jgi:hypothetical protein
MDMTVYNMCLERFSLTEKTLEPMVDDLMALKTQVQALDVAA